jgi:hypothetical protein
VRRTRTVEYTDNRTRLLACRTPVRQGQHLFSAIDVAGMKLAVLACRVAITARVSEIRGILDLPGTRQREGVPTQRWPEGFERRTLHHEPKLPNKLDLKMTSPPLPIFPAFMQTRPALCEQATTLWLRLSTEQNPTKAQGILQRLIANPKMKSVWTEIYKKKQLKPDEYLHPACLTEASQAAARRAKATELRKKGGEKNTDSAPCRPSRDHEGPQGFRRTAFEDPGDESGIGRFSLCQAA